MNLNREWGFIAEERDGRSLAGVDAQMDLHVALVGEGFVAEIAPEELELVGLSHFSK